MSIPVATAEPARLRLRILSVEDDALVAMGTTGLLEDLGHEVIEANTGPQALAILDGGAAIDLLITDQGMPGMTGLELARAARCLRAALPVILVTGYIQLPQEAGSTFAVLQKPFREADLAKAIHEAVPGIAPAAVSRHG